MQQTIVEETLEQEIGNAVGLMALMDVCVPTHPLRREITMTEDYIAHICEVTGFDYGLMSLLYEKTVEYLRGLDQAELMAEVDQARYMRG